MAKSNTRERRKLNVKDAVAPTRASGAQKTNNDGKVQCKVEDFVPQPRQNLFNDDGKLEAKFSIKRNEEERKLLNDPMPRGTRDTIQYVSMTCHVCENEFEIPNTTISQEFSQFWRCDLCCKKGRKRRRGI